MQRLAEKAVATNPERSELQISLGASPRLPAVGAASKTARESRAVAPLRVLHVINRLDVGGTESGILKVMTGLGDELFEHRLCTIRGFDPRLARNGNLEGKVSVAGNSNSQFQFLLFRLARIMREYQPHIVHSRNWGTIEAVPAARLTRVPITIHSEHGYEVDMLAGLPLRRRLLRRVVYAMADAVFTVTRELSAFHAEQAGIARDRIRVIYNGVDTRRFAPRAEVRPRLREQLGLPTGSFVVGTVGRLVPIKDHATLLKAAERLERQGTDVHVLLVGSGPERDRLERLVEASSALRGRVVFAGPSENVPDLLNAMDVFVLASIGEGMSNTLLEAMASGLPVIATRTGGSPELVEEDRSGWLFEPGHAAELAELLARLAGSSALRGRLGAEARQRAVAQFSLDRMLADYRNLYLELAHRRGIQTAD